MSIYMTKRSAEVDVYRFPNAEVKQQVFDYVSNSYNNFTDVRTIYFPRRLTNRLKKHGRRFYSRRN